MKNNINKKPYVSRKNISPRQETRNSINIDERVSPLLGYAPTELRRRETAPEPDHKELEIDYTVKDDLSV
jgi:hypothetical protein